MLSTAAAEAIDPADLITHQGGPLLIEGAAQSGKTTLLMRRFQWLVSQGTPPERIALVSPSPARADAIRARIEGGLPDGYGELGIVAPGELAALVLRSAPARRHLPDALLGAGERLAMLAERIDELDLTHHDFGGNASALLAGFIVRIDALKAEMITADAYGAWAGQLDDDASLRLAVRSGRVPMHGAREREFAAIYAAHDRMLRQASAVDRGDLLLAAVRAAPEIDRFDHLLADDVQELGLAAATLAQVLGGARLTAAGDSRAGGAFRGAAAARLAAFTTPGTHHAVLPEVERPSPHRYWRAENERAQAQATAAAIERLIRREEVPPGRIAVLVPDVARDGRPVSAALEERVIPHRLVGEGAFFQRPEIRDLLAWLRLAADPADAPAAVRVLARPPVELRSVDIARCTQIARRRKLDMVAALAAATESPQVPPEARERIRSFLKLYRASAAPMDSTRPDLYVHGLIERLGLRRRHLFAAQTEVVEQLRALARFGELATSHLKRTPMATARDFARSVAAVADQSALAVGTPEEPDLIDPDVVQVVAIDAAAGLEVDHVFVLGLSAAWRPPEEPELPDALLGDAGVGAPAGLEERLAQRLYSALSRAGVSATVAYPASRGGRTAQPLAALEAERLAAGLEWEDHAEELFGPAETLQASYRALRDELLEGTTRAASRLAELRLDTDLDISHAVVRYLELLKVAALMARADGQDLADTLHDVNARIGQALTAQQREIFESSPLDAYLRDAEADERGRAKILAARDEPSLKRFLPLRGDGVLLSAHDIETYRACPLKYKFARVFRIPQEPTLHQRFGIAVHQVLERFHGADPTGLGSLNELFELLDTAWRRQGFGDSDEERQLRTKAEAALARYHEQARAEEASPVWFERQFSFRLGPHLVRGRVDRVDRLPDGGYELIDYKTGRPKSAEALAEDVQLSIYTVAAQEAWDLEGARGAYLYLLDDAKVAIPADPERGDWIREVATQTAEGIQAQEFEPTPSVSACGFCDYRLACPAAER